MGEKTNDEIADIILNGVKGYVVQWCAPEDMAKNEFRKSLLKLLGDIDKSQLAAANERVEVLVPSDEVIDMLEALWLDGDSCTCKDRDVPCYECKLFMVAGGEELCHCVAHKIHAWIEKIKAALPEKTEGREG